MANKYIQSKMDKLTDRQLKPKDFTIRIESFLDMKNLYEYKFYEELKYNSSVTLKDTIQHIVIKAIRARENQV